MPDFPTKGLYWQTWWRDRPLVVAHRGASQAAPQNTLMAFRLAAEMGADAVELDVHLTADNVPVVIHDATVDATTNGTGAVRQMSLAQLKTLNIVRGERIPTLEEVLAEVGQRLLINIEFKDHTLRGMGLEAIVGNILRQMHMLDRVWFSSFNPFSLRRARAAIPEVPCGMLYSRQLPIYLRHRWLAPLTPHEALHPEHTLVTSTLIENAHRRGLRVAAWTLDDPERAQRLAAWGIDAIITNVPDQILEAVEKYKNQISNAIEERT
jgi:glycerophosphoryl diester phosphodiesterase